MDDIHARILLKMVCNVPCVHCSSLVWLHLLLKWFTNLQVYFEGNMWRHCCILVPSWGIIDCLTRQSHSILLWLLEHLRLTSHRNLHCIYPLHIFANFHQNSAMHNRVTRIHKSDLLHENIRGVQFLGADADLCV